MVNSISSKPLNVTKSAAASAPQSACQGTTWSRQFLDTIFAAWNCQYRTIEFPTQ